MGQCEVPTACIVCNDKMVYYPVAAEHLKKKLRFPQDLLSNHDTRARMIIADKKG